MSSYTDKNGHHHGRVKRRIPQEQYDALITELKSLPKQPTILNKIIDEKLVVIVKFSEAMLEAAMHHAETINIVAKAKGKHEYMQSNEDQRKAGYMAQLAVAYWVYGDWTIAFKNVKIGEADDGDLRIGKFIVNVITNSYVITEPRTNLAIIDCKRFDRNPFPLAPKIKGRGEDNC